jgi:CRP/FNR family transcriptional regulator, anaerobic regulatory protein
MKSPPVTGALNVIAKDAPVAYLRVVAPRRRNVDAAPAGLHSAMALQCALASTKRELVAALQEVALLVEANARLNQRDRERERGFAEQRQRAPRDLPGGQRRVEATNLVPLLQHSPVAAAGCLSTRLTDFCPFAGLDPATNAQVERLLTKRVRLRKGDVLYRVGGEFSVLYAIRMGSCKTVMLARDGHEQVAGYYMAGDVIGLDGIGTDIHGCQATALEDTEVCPLPFDEIENLAHLNEDFQRKLHRLLTQRYASARALIIALGTMTAEQRIAMFLLDLSQRYGVRGYSSCEFVLRMTREEIGSYLGLKLETVSRLFSRLQRDGLIQVEGRSMKLLDRVALKRLVDGCT